MYNLPPQTISKSMRWKSNHFRHFLTSIFLS